MSEERAEVALRLATTSLPLYWKPENSASSRSRRAASPASASGAPPPPPPPAARRRTLFAAAPYAQPGTPYTKAHFARSRAVAVARYTKPGRSVPAGMVSTSDALGGSATVCTLLAT